MNQATTAGDSYATGVDLGTTFTAAAVTRGEGRPEVISLGDRAASVPSVVLIRDDATVLVGQAASRRAVVEPDRVAREFKRRLGDTIPLLLGGAPHSAESLQAKLLRSVLDSIEQHEGGPPASVTVTYPANWGPYKRELLSQILRMAGVSDARTITEPEAAAVHYAANERVEVGEIVAVYDLGGGTFDAAVLRKTEEGFEVLGTPDGLEHLGGVDFDHAVLQHVNAALGGALDRLDFDDPTARADLARLHADCAEAKEALSTDTEATIPVSIAGIRTDVRLTRAELDEMTAPAIAETIDALGRAIASAGVSTADVSRILLVGGASRMPLVARMVATEIGRPVFLDAHPKFAIALGAAISARRTRVADDPVAVDVPEETAPPAAVPASAPVAGEAEPALPPPPVSSKPRLSTVLSRTRVVALGIVMALVASGAGFVLFLRPQADASDAVLFQDPVTRGPSPFTKPAVHDVVASSEGAPHGPFGGSGTVSECNKELLVKFLNANPDRKAAWAGVLGVRVEDFASYVKSLRSAVLTEDTRVTNHGFKSGRAFELQSILAKGTAVLVDRDGQIVTRCFCGNPLTAPKPRGASTCKGCPRNAAPSVTCTGAECYRFVSSAEENGDAEATGKRSATASGAASSSTLQSQTRQTQAAPPSASQQAPTPNHQVVVVSGNTVDDDNDVRTGDASTGFDTGGDSFDDGDTELDEDGDDSGNGFEDGNTDDGAGGNQEQDPEPPPTVN